MTRVEITIHKHACAICGDLFVWRPSRPDQDGGCSCDTHPGAPELCDPCLKRMDEAGWLGTLVKRLIERTISIHQRLEAIESKQVPQ